MYMRKPEIPVGKSNGSCNSVWEALKNMVYSLRQCNFFSLFSWQRIVLPRSQILFYLCTRFPPRWSYHLKVVTILGTVLLREKMNVFVAWEGCYCPQYTTTQVRYRVPTGNKYIYYDDGEQYFYKKRVSSVSNVIAWERREEIFKKSYFFLLIQWFVRRARRGNASGISLPTRRPDIIFRPAVRSRSCS